MKVPLIFLAACLLLGLVPALTAQDLFLDSDAESDCLQAPLIAIAGTYVSLSCTLDGYTVFDEHYQAISGVYVAYCSTAAYLTDEYGGDMCFIASESSGETTGGAYVYDYFIRYPDGSGVGVPSDTVPC
jgi:hypothetical protein